MFPGLWDQLRIGKQLLTDFRHVHSDKLAQLPIRFPVSFGTFTPGANTTLLDLVSYGIENKAFSCDVVQLLRRELSVVTEFPVLVAVDDYNAFLSNSSFSNPLSKRFKAEILPASKLTLAHTFSDFDKNPFVRATSAPAIASTAVCVCVPTAWMLIIYHTMQSCRSCEAPCWLPRLGASAIELSSKRRCPSARPCPSNHTARPSSKRA